MATESPTNVDKKTNKFPTSKTRFREQRPLEWAMSKSYELQVKELVYLKVITMISIIFITNITIVMCVVSVSAI